MSNCPYCGADQIHEWHGLFDWGCGTGQQPQIGTTQTDRCRIRELEQRNEKLEEAAINYMMRTSHSDACPCISNNVFDDRCLCGHDELKAALSKEPGDDGS